MLTTKPETQSFPEAQSPFTMMGAKMLIPQADRMTIRRHERRKDVFQENEEVERYDE
jgi:hypothetical protein